MLNNFFNFFISVECTCSESLDELHRIEDKACNIKCNDYQSSCGASQDGIFSVYTKGKDSRNFYRSDEAVPSLKQLQMLEKIKFAMFSTTSKQAATENDLQKIYLICLLSLIILIIFILFVVCIYFKQNLKVYFKNLIYLCLRKINLQNKNSSSISDEEKSRSSSILSVNSSKSSNRLNSKQNLTGNFSEF